MLFKIIAKEKIFIGSSNVLHDDLGLRALGGYEELICDLDLSGDIENQIINCIENYEKDHPNSNFIYTFPNPFKL